jgi:hypothetical protein
MRGPPSPPRSMTDMDAYFSIRLETLQAQLVCSRLEKSRLYSEIACPSTEPWKKQEAMLRVAALVTELRKISSELDKLQGKRRP